MCEMRRRRVGRGIGVGGCVEGLVDEGADGRIIHGVDQTDNSQSSPARDSVVDFLAAAGLRLHGPRVVNGSQLLLAARGGDGAV